MKTKKEKPSPKRGFGSKFMNFAGIFSGFAIALGGLFLLQEVLDREQEKLLAGSGIVELPRTDDVEQVETGEVSVPAMLGDEELFQLVTCLEHKGEIQPHEPVQGQLTMAQAMEYGLAWLEEFFLRRFGLSESFAREYGVSCYLWSLENEAADGEEHPWLSCWTVSVRSQDIDAALTMSAVSGQVLDASISCSVPVLCESDDISLLLLEYAGTFGLEDDHMVTYSDETDFGAKKLPWYRSISTQGLYAAIQADSVATAVSGEDSETETEFVYYEEFFNLHLYLCSEAAAAAD